MQFGGQHPGGMGVPAVGMAFPGYVAQPQLGLGNSEMTWYCSYIFSSFVWFFCLIDRLESFMLCERDSFLRSTYVSPCWVNNWLHSQLLK